MQRTHMTNTIVLPKGELVIENEVDKPMVSAQKGIGINVVTLPQEMFYVLQDVITTKLQAGESCMLQVLSEQRINMEQLSVQCDEVVSQNRQMVQVIKEARQMVPKLAILVETAAEVCEARE